MNAKDALTENCSLSTQASAQLLYVTGWNKKISVTTNAAHYKLTAHIHTLH